MTRTKNAVDAAYAERFCNPTIQSRWPRWANVAPAVSTRRWPPASASTSITLLIVDGRTFTWDQIGRMLMTFEGFTLNATVADTIEVVGGPLAEGRLDSHPSHEPAAAVPAAVVSLALPFGATVAGEAVIVEKIDLRGADELIAICRRRGKRETVRLLDRDERSDSV